MKTIQWLGILICLLSLSLMVSGCDGGGVKDKKMIPAQTQSIQIVTATTGGVYHPLGVAVAQLFNQQISGIKATAEATAGTVQNILLMQKRTADVAFAQNGVAHYAFTGTEFFKNNPMRFLRGISNLYPNVIHILVAANSNIKSIQDFEGKIIVPGGIGSATEINSKEILGLYGLHYKDERNVKGEYLAYSESVTALKNGRVDGILIAGGLPTAAVVDAAAALDIRILSLDQEMIIKLCEAMPWYFAVTIPKGTYRGQSEDVRTVAVANLLVCREDLNEALVYNMTRAVHENLQELEKAHSAANAINLQEATKHMSIPLHPGAEKYYKEKLIVK